MIYKEYKKMEKAFKEYYKDYKDMSSNIILKYNHSFAVASYMENLATRLKMNKSDIYLAKTIGLLHDIGRFEQLKKFHSFNDQQFDHAEFSIYYLFDQGHIRDFLEDNQYDIIIRNAILNHNRYKIQKGLSARELLFAKMIRDMDKVDIFYQIANKRLLHFNCYPSKKTLNYYNKGKCILKEDVKNDSDKVLQVIAFLNDFNFDESFEILKESNNLDCFLNSIEVDEEYKELFSEIIKLHKNIMKVGDIYGK